jgi:hypothetical protein
MIDNTPQVPQASRAELPSNGEFLKFKIRQMVTRQFKGYLDILELLVDDHDEAMGKLMDSLPVQYKVNVKLADYLPNHRLEDYRQRILDVGNDVIRDLEETIDNLRIE